MKNVSLRHLSLSHFRSHKSANLDIGDKPIAIYGANGAGKTNILEAVSMLSPGRGLRRAKTEELMRQPDAIGWKIGALVDTGADPIELETRYDGEGPRNVSIDGKSASQTALGKILRIVWLVPVMDRLWVESATGRRRFLDRLALSFEPEHAVLSTQYERAMRERNRLLKDGVSDPAWYRAIEDQMAQAGSVIEANRLTTISKLHQAQENADTEFPFADLELVGPDMTPIETNAEGLRERLEHSRQRCLAAGRSLVGPHRDDLNAVFRAKNLAAAQCSTGEQKALLVSLILSNARALSADAGTTPIILLDEVGAHLDENRRAALYDEICALGAQVWMTATDFALYDALGSRADYIEVREGAQGSILEMKTLNQ
ncbi:MAG: DNA replication/repair protein RecF [Pseudomonadota bacterium]